MRSRRLGAPAGRRQATRQGRTLPASLSLVLVLASLATLVLSTAPTGAATLPAGFQESVVFNGLTNPTAVRFA